MSAASAIRSTAHQITSCRTGCFSSIHFQNILVTSSVAILSLFACRVYTEHPEGICYRKTGAEGAENHRYQRQDYSYFKFHLLTSFISWYNHGKGGIDYES